MERLQRGPVLWTQDTMRAVLDLNQRPSPVGSAPGTGQACLDIIWPAPLMTERAVILISGGGSHRRNPDKNRVRSQLRT